MLFFLVASKVRGVEKTFAVLHKTPRYFLIYYIISSFFLVPFLELPPPLSTSIKLRFNSLFTMNIIARSFHVLYGVVQ